MLEKRLSPTNKCQQTLAVFVSQASYFWALSPADYCNQYAPTELSNCSFICCNVFPAYLLSHPFKEIYDFCIMRNCDTQQMSVSEALLLLLNYAQIQNVENEHCYLGKEFKEENICTYNKHLQL